MENENCFRHTVVNIDITDIMKSVEIYLKDAARTFTTASGATIDQISAISIVETIAEEVMDNEHTSGPGQNGDGVLEYVKEVLGENYSMIYRLLSTKIHTILGELTEGDICGCKDINVSSFCTLTLTMSIFRRD